MAKKIIGTINVSEVQLISETTDIAQRWSENLQIQITFNDAYWTGYSLLWLFAHDSDMQKTGICKYDAGAKTLTLPPGAFDKDGYLYLSLRGIKADEVITSLPIYFYINTSGNPDASNIPREPGWVEIAQGLMEQIFENEYKKPLDDLIKNTNAEIKRIIDKADGDYTAIKKEIDEAIAKYKADYNKFVSETLAKYETDRQSMVKEVSETLKKFNDEARVAIEIVEEINERLANDEFRGAQGVQGIQGKQGVIGPVGATGAQGIQGVQGIKGDKGDKGDTGLQGTQGLTGATGIQGLQGIQGAKGDKGDKGAQGLSGVTALTSGMFALVGDSVTGDLFVEYPDSTHPPGFEVDVSNNIYLVI